MTDAEITIATGLIVVVAHACGIVVLALWCIWYTARDLRPRKPRRKKKSPARRTAVRRTTRRRVA